MTLIGSELFMKKLLVFDRIFWVMFCEIADCLRQVYAQEKQSISGWFCVFLLKVARMIKAPFLVAKYHAYYVGYLQCSNKLSEALVQANCLQRFLVNEFGEDYLDWLENAPNAVELCQRLENISQQTSPVTAEALSISGTSEIFLFDEELKIK